MIAILSPAKTLDFETKYQFSDITIPSFIEDSKELIDQLKNYGQMEYQFNEFEFFFK